MKIALLHGQVDVIEILTDIPALKIIGQNLKRSYQLRQITNSSEFGTVESSQFWRA
jgi:hypothetical protein